MPACESKLVSRSSRKATVAKTVLIGYRPRSCDRMPSLVGERGTELRVPGWALTLRMRNVSLVATTLKWTRKLKSGCVWNRAVSCLAT